jgi:hypothetical protein
MMSRRVMFAGICLLSVVEYAVGHISPLDQAVAGAAVEPHTITILRAMTG